MAQSIGEILLANAKLDQSTNVLLTAETTNYVNRPLYMHPHADVRESYSASTAHSPYVKTTIGGLLLYVTRVNLDEIMTHLIKDEHLCHHNITHIEAIFQPPPTKCPVFYRPEDKEGNFLTTAETIHHDTPQGLANFSQQIFDPKCATDLALPASHLTQTDEDVLRMSATRVMRFPHSRDIKGVKVQKAVIDPRSGKVISSRMVEHYPLDSKFAEQFLFLKPHRYQDLMSELQHSEVVMNKAGKCRLEVDPKVAKRVHEFKDGFETAHTRLAHNIHGTFLAFYSMLPNIVTNLHLKVFTSQAGGDEAAVCEAMGAQRPPAMEECAAAEEAIEAEEVPEVIHRTTYTTVGAEDRSDEDEDEEDEDA